MTTWKELLEVQFKYRGDDFSRMVTTLTLEELNRPFDDGAGGHEGAAFTAWGERYVYFPAVYGGIEWVESVPRYPCNEATGHVGGE